MSNISAELKKRRKQHRQDHNTDLDRMLSKEYKGSQRDRVAARKGLYQTDNKNAAGFNFDQFGKGHISRGEVKHLKEQGFSNKDIMAAAIASGNEIGNNAQNIFSRWEATARKPQVQATPSPSDPVVPTAPKPVVPTAPKSEIINSSTSNNLSQDIELNNPQKNYMVGDNLRNEQYADNSVEQEGGDIFSMAGSGPDGAEALKNLYVEGIIDNTQKQKVKSTSPQENVMIGNGSHNFQFMDNSLTNKGGNIYNYAYT